MGSSIRKMSQNPFFLLKVTKMSELTVSDALALISGKLDEDQLRITFLCDTTLVDPVELLNFTLGALCVIVAYFTDSAGVLRIHNHRLLSHQVSFLLNKKRG
jgi:hypothetical protein